jgi:cysteinyl-tRNA synthetase
LPGAGNAPDKTLAALQSQMEATEQGFREAMDDDFNTAGALGHMFELVRSINQARDGGADAAVLGPAQDLLRNLASVLGLRLEREGEGAQAAPFIDLLVEIRRDLRQQKLWSLSDMVRDRLLALGVILEDSKDGTTWRFIKLRDKG